MASFQALPPELLIAILEALIHNAHPRDHSQILKVTTFVSKEWQAIIQSTRSLWCTVSNEDPPSWVQQVLRTGEPDGPLNVRFAQLWDHEPETILVKNLVLPVIDRWLDLRIEATSLPDTEMLTVLAPTLRRLSIFSRYPTTVHTTLADQFPLLQSLSLNMVSIPWESPALRSQSLHNLFISRIHNDGLDMHILLDILTSCPNLVLLSLRDVTLESLSIMDASTVSMARLSHIDLQLDIEYIIIILKKLQLPADVKYSVTVDNASSAIWKYVEDILIPPLTRFIKRIPTLEAPRVVLRNSAGGWILKIPSEACALEIPATMDLRPTLSLLGDLPVAVVYDGVAALASGMSSQLSLSRIDELLQDNVTHLRLLPDCPDFFGILTALSGSPNGENRIFPELRVLDLEQIGFKSTGLVFKPTELMFKPTGLMFPFLLSRLRTLIEARQSSGRTLLVRLRCSNTEVKNSEGLRGLSGEFPESFVFRDDGHGVEWWEKPDLPLDPNYEGPRQEESDPFNVIL